MYSNPIPFNVAPSGPNVVGGISLSNPSTVAPPRVFAGVPGSTGAVTNGPPGVGRVPSINTGMTGTTSGLYNGGTPGNRSMGFGTMGSNEPIPASYIIVKSQEVDRSGTMARNLHEGMMLFCAVQPRRALLDGGSDESLDGEPVSKPLAHTIHGSALRIYGHKVHVMYDLYGVNEHLKALAGTDYAEIRSPRDVFRFWSLVGVFKNQAAPARHSYDEQPDSRMVNLIIASRVRTFNIWGTDIFPGTQLYVIAKKVMTGDSKRHRGADGRYTEECRYCWTLYPYADRQHRVPPAKELVYYDEDGEDVLKYGAYLHVGTASERSEPYDMGLQARSSNDNQPDKHAVLKQSLDRLQIVNDMHSGRGRIPDQIEILVCV